MFIFRVTNQEVISIEIEREKGRERDRQRRVGEYWIHCLCYISVAMPIVETL